MMPVLLILDAGYVEPNLLRIFGVRQYPGV